MKYTLLLDIDEECSKLSNEQIENIAQNQTMPGWKFSHLIYNEENRPIKVCVDWCKEGEPDTQPYEAHFL